MEDWSFLRNYDVELERRRTSIIVRVTPFDAAPWETELELDPTPVPGGLTGTAVYSHPDPDAFCVVSDGEAWIVRGSDRTHPEEVQLIPITSVLPAPEHGLLVFADFQRVEAHGRDGVAWRIERLAEDEVQLRSSDSGSIRGTAWRGGEGDVEFSIDPRTGEFETAPAR